MSVEHLNWLTSVPIAIPICVLGIIGNLISIAVWLRFVRKKIGSSPSSAIYFVALGFVDTGLLVFFLLTDAIQTAAGPKLSQSYAYGWFYSYVGFPMFFFCIVASIWMLVGLTINRLIMVRFPIQARRHCTVQRAYVAIFCILLFSFIINFPHFFNFKAIRHHAGGEVSFQETPYTHRGSAKQYEFWVHCMFLVLVPWGSIAVLNSWIIVTMVHNSKQFQELEADEEKISDRRRQDRQITKTLLTVTFAFLILLAWQCINQCFFMLKFGEEERPDKWKLVQETYAFAKIGVVVNSSINCVLYCFSGSTFRKELRRFVLSEPDSTSVKRSSTPRTAAV